MMQVRVRHESQDENRSIFLMHVSQLDTERIVEQIANNGGISFGGCVYRNPKPQLKIANRMAYLELTLSDEELGGISIESIEQGLDEAEKDAAEEQQRAAEERAACDFGKLKVERAFIKWWHDSPGALIPKRFRSSLKRAIEQDLIDDVDESLELTNKGRNVFGY